MGAFVRSPRHGRLSRARRAFLDAAPEFGGPRGDSAADKAKAVAGAKYPGGIVNRVHFG
jgi:hypothetical protein